MLIGIDIGGTTARVAAFKSTDDSTPVSRRDFSVTRDYATDMVDLQAAIREVAGDSAIEGIGLGIAGVVDPTGSTITGSGRLESWHGKPVQKDLRTTFDCPVVLANDSLVTALAEAIYGKIPKEPFWMVTWGTGIGGSLVEFDGDTPRVTPSELGHIVIHPEDSVAADGCGHPGCLESLVGGDGIERRFGKLATDLDSAEWDQVVDWFARGLYDLLVVQFPPHLVLGGGLAVKCADRIPQITAALEKRLEIVPMPKVSSATHGEDAGLVGALALLRS